LDQAFWELGSMREFLESQFGPSIDAFGYSVGEWEDSLTALQALCPKESLERLAGYIACCAEAGERTGRLLPLREEVLRHFKTFGLEG